MLNEENTFSDVYNGMSILNTRIKDVINLVYDEIKKNPYDENLKKLLSDLEDIAQCGMDVQVIKKDNFSSVYDGMDVLYSKVDDLMGMIYKDLKKGISDNKTEKFLSDLKKIAQCVIYIQAGIVKNYPDKKKVSVLLGAVNSKAEELEKISDIRVNKARI